MTSQQTDRDRFFRSVTNTIPIAFADNTDADIGMAPRLRCPTCHTVFPNISAEGRFRMTCARCGFLIAEEGGIIRALTPESKARFEPFAREYKVVRDQEHWGSTSPDYYLSLPFRDMTQLHDWIWRIRARTWSYIQRRVLRQHERCRTSLRVLDIGAGNGWLSYRLTQKGYQAVAVDLLDDAIDGLAAAAHYFPHLPRPFLRFQADMNQLPFESGQFDVAIFNASFHYSHDSEETLREAMRCVRRSGIVIIADTPCYRNRQSGERMLKEREKRFNKNFGMRPSETRNLEYLTPQTISELAEKLSIQWKVGKPWYGVSWALRPIKACVLGLREPSKFYIWWFRLPG
jgi:SAM-dependent methyltransferase